MVTKEQKMSSSLVKETEPASSMAEMGKVKKEKVEDKVFVALEIKGKKCVVDIGTPSFRPASGQWLQLDEVRSLYLEILQKNSGLVEYLMMMQMLKSMIFCTMNGWLHKAFYQKINQGKVIFLIYMEIQRKRKKMKM